MPFLSALELKYIGGELWSVAHDFLYEWDRMDRHVLVNQGFITDQASVPLIIIPILVNDTGRISRAAVIHDYLYAKEDHDGFTRKEADLLFYDAMLESGMKKWRAGLAWMGVRSNLLASWKW